LLTIAGLLVVDYLLEEEMKAVTHRDDLSSRKFYKP
jgi:hypothetical protein